MSDQPRDPAKSTVDQSHVATETFDGQKGYGVEYEDGRYISPDMQEMPPGGRSGSNEANNAGGYGSSPTEGARQSGEPKVTPPDPEADQGQGGE